MLRINLRRELTDEVEQELMVATTNSIVVDPQKDAVGVLFWIETKEQFAVLQSRFGATLSTEHVDVFHEAVTENGVQVLAPRSLIKLDLRHEELRISEVVLDFFRCDWLEFGRKSILKRKNASF